jgi:hypothetical protein
VGELFRCPALVARERAAARNLDDSRFAISFTSQLFRPLSAIVVCRRRRRRSQEVSQSTEVFPSRRFVVAANIKFSSLFAALEPRHATRRVTCLSRLHDCAKHKTRLAAGRSFLRGPQGASSGGAFIPRRTCKETDSSSTNESPRSWEWCPCPSRKRAGGGSI